MSVLLEARDLRFRYPGGTRAAVESLSIVLEKGDFVGIVGPNGSGKSTLLRLLYGALSPEAGEVRLQGQPLRKWTPKALAQRIAVVGQEPSWHFPMTVHDFVLQGRYPYLGRFGFETSQDDTCVEEALAQVHLTDFSRRQVQQLSAGERQRMLLARALVQRPEIFMLDEPTANLDLRRQIEVLQLMRQLQRSFGFAVLLISHEVNLIIDFVRRLVLLKDGRTLAEGTPQAVVTPENFERLFEVPFQLHSGTPGSVRRWIFPSAQGPDGT